MKVSVKSITVWCCSLFLLSACGKKEQELTPAQIQARADSIVRSKLPKMQQQAKEDLEKRLPIELKPKVDSIRKVNSQIEPVPVFPEDDVPAAEAPAATKKDSAK